MASEHDRQLMRFRVGMDGVLYMGEVDEKNVVHEPHEPPPSATLPAQNLAPPPNGF